MEDAPGSGAEIPLQPVVKPMLEKAYSKGTAAHEENPCWRGQKNVRRNEQQRRAVSA